MGESRAETMLARLGEIDRHGVRWVRELRHPPALNRSMAVLSRVTDHSDAWMAIGLLGAILDAQRRRRWLDAASRIALVELSARAIKRLVPRPRPALEGLPPLAPTPSPRSFPSSHTAAAVAAVDAFTGLIPRPVLRLVAVAAAFSRLYLGVHFPSDVVAGAGLGALLGSRC